MLYLQDEAHILPAYNKVSEKIWYIRHGASNNSNFSINGPKDYH